MTKVNKITTIVLPSYSQSMNGTTVNSMNFLHKKTDVRVQSKIPQAMRDHMAGEISRFGFKSESVYIKTAIQEKFERDSIHE